MVLDGADIHIVNITIDSQLIYDMIYDFFVYIYIYLILIQLHRGLDFAYVLT